MVFNFHAGKLEVQSRAGTSGEAARILNAGWIGTAIRCETKDAYYGLLLLYEYGSLFYVAYYCNYQSARSNIILYELPQARCTAVTSYYLCAVCVRCVV